MITDEDISMSLLIALAIIVIAVGVWPGYGRVKAAQVAGNWSSQDSGAIYRVEPVGPRAFEVYAGGALYARGQTGGLRKVRLVVLATGETHSGTLEFAARQIAWDRGGDTWIYQGVR